MDNLDRIHGLGEGMPGFGGPSAVGGQRTEADNALYKEKRR